MEPVGFTVGVVGLAGLFSVCLDVIDRVESYKDFAVESRSIIAQFEADKHLFTKWAKDVGIQKEGLRNNHHSYLDNPQTNLVVRNILSSIQEIFSKTENTLSDLQPVVEAGPTSFPAGIHSLSIRTKVQGPNGTISKRGRIGWSLRNKAKFNYQVQQFGALVQRLYSLVPTDGVAEQLNMHKDRKFNNPSSGQDSVVWLSHSQRLLLEMEKQIEHETRKELDIWLGASWTNDVYDNFIQKRLDGTCDWILDRQAFHDWVSPDFSSGTPKILWINGPPGHGKTILCARVVQYLSNTLKYPLAYYFCSSDSESRRSPFSIIKSWISQVISCERDAFELACKVWETKDGHNASQMDILEVFKAIVQHVPNCTFVVDGLDECAWGEGRWKSFNDDSSMTFFDSINQAIAHTTTRILLLSRDESEIRYGLRAIFLGDSNHGFNEYKICPDDVRFDILSFSRSTVNKKLRNKSERLKEELSQKIVDRCEGMFLWVRMLEEQLRSGKNQKQLEEIIEQSPTVLERLYDRNWIKISQLPDRDKLRAFSILRWVAFAIRPLTISEITEALLIVDDDDCEDLPVEELPDAIDEDYISGEILGLCGSLLEIQNATKRHDLGSMTVHLSHFSVKQYIICNMPAQGEILIANGGLCASIEGFHSNILAKLCLRYLKFRILVEESLGLKRSPFQLSFHDYAAGSWYNHVRESGTNYKEVFELVNVFFSSNDKNWESWRKWFNNNGDSSNMPKFRRRNASTSPLFYASLIGLRETVIHLLKRADVDVNYSDRYNRTALQAAASKGRTSTVMILLESGADLAISDENGWTPLILASRHGHAEVVKSLLENGADISFSDNGGWTSLHLASCNGHAEVVKLLLENGAYALIAKRDGWTPLQLASCNGHAEVVKLLLEIGADASTARNDGRTPLHLASYNGHAEVVKSLLENGADISLSDNGGWMPLHLASSKGHAEVVKSLLENGAKTSIANRGGWVPLQLASSKGHAKVVRLLLENGANVSIESPNGTPLIIATRIGNFEVVKLLLKNGATPDLKDLKYGRTALSYAANLESNSIIELLLATREVNLDLGDVIGRTPLSYAAMKGHDAIVIALLANKNINADAKDHYGTTPLSLAIRHGHAEVIKLLLATDYVDLNSRDCFGRTPLSWARKLGNADIIQLLLDSAKTGVIFVDESNGTMEMSFALGKKNIWCDICTLYVLSRDAHYHCELCCGGDFDICLECYTGGGRCLDVTHVLAQVEADDESK